MRAFKPHLLALAINIVTLAFLYSQTRFVDADLRYAQLAEINDLKIISLLLDRDLFRLNFGQLSNYDSLVDGQKRRDRILQDLTALSDSSVARSDAQDLITKARAIAFATDRAIDLIKRAHSQLKNSQAYFPLLIKDLTARAATLPAAEEVVFALSRLEDLIAIHSSTQSGESRDAVDQKLHELEAYHRQHLAGDEALLGDFAHALEHARVIATQVGHVRVLVDSYLRSDFYSLIDQIYDTYSTTFAEEQKRSQSLFPLYYCVQLVLFGQVLLLFYQLIHTNKQVVEQAKTVQERLDRERQLNGLQRQFVSMMSHEFRTPLAIIDGNAQRLQRRAGAIAPDRLHAITGTIRTSVRRLTDLMESVLNISRMEEGRIDCRRVDFGLADLINDVANNYREVSADREFKVELEQLPATFNADPRLLRQVLSNLVSNAVKYSAAGAPVTIRCHRHGDEIALVVRDQGVGIPPDEIGRLFERFFRASTSTGIAGTGIGLHLVQHIVDLHEGRIAVESDPGVGSSFAVYLPLQPACSAGAATPPRCRESSSAAGRVSTKSEQPHQNEAAWSDR